MVTYAQLQAESEWGREFAPPSLLALRTKLLAHWGLSASAIGIKGDNNHLRGYHRSREWILGSAYCTNRTYSVSETAGNRSGGDSRWLAAMDISLPTAQLIAVCKRLDIAVRAGRLEKITEWYGNFDGDTRVDGYNNIANRVATSDSSHLTHLHMSFDRGRAGEDHSDLFNILTGADVTAQEVWEHPISSRYYGYSGTTGDLLKKAFGAEQAANNALAEVRAMRAVVDQMFTEVKALKSASLPPELAAQVVDELGARLTT